MPATAQSGIAQVSTGRSHTCALSTVGAVTCWGDNGYGQSTLPTPPTLPTRVYPTTLARP